ncbi:hypothetical protein [Streptomyces sp. NRRL S-1813]|uniref:hypothetical protein n=1 Tax=Streptomyces sp. NRRL S-1813 TaxID=1463888 RepID=UPI003B6376A3
MWDKGLIYQGHSVSWYCPHCETPLANAESSGRIDGSDIHRDAKSATSGAGCGRRPVPTARRRVHASMRLRVRGEGSVEVFRARPIRRPTAPRSGRPRRGAVRNGNSPGGRTAPRQLR